MLYFVKKGLFTGTIFKGTRIGNYIWVKEHPSQSFPVDHCVCLDPEVPERSNN